MEWGSRIAALVFLLCVSAVHAQSASFADLARHAEYKDVKISPDGEYLAATAVVKGHTVLALIHLSDKKVSVIRPREDDDVTDFWWASPKRVIYAIGTRLGGYDSPMATGELFAVNADGNSPDMLYGYRKPGMTTGTLVGHTGAERGNAEFIAAIPDDPEHILVSVSLWDTTGYELSLPSAYRMDVRTGDKIKIITAPMRGAEFVADHHGKIRFAFSPANDGSLKVYLHPVGGDGWQLMPGPGETRSRPISFNHDDSLVYFTCPGTAGGFGICSWDPAKQSMTPLWSNPKVEADGLMQGLTDDEFIGVTYTDGRPGTALFDSTSADAKALVMLMKQFAGERVDFASSTRDGRLSVVLVEADADPGAFYLFDHTANKLTALLSRAPWINPEKMARKQPFEFAARDGLKLQGYVTFPPGQENAKHLPMVVFVHGGPNARDSWNYDPEVQAMATRGYAVLQVNFRGSTGRGYAFKSASSREWGGKMQDDVTDATHWAIAQDIANPQRICIFGASYGGYAALEGAVKEPDLYKCAIGYVGVYDLRMMYHEGDTHQSVYGEDFLKRELGEDMTVLTARSPVNQLDSLKARVMLVVGGKDERVPPMQGMSLHQALLNRHIAHEWVLKPGEMHGFYDEANRTELYTDLLQFIGTNIGPGATAPETAATSTASTH